MEKKKQEQAIITDEDIIELPNPDEYYLDEETGLGVKQCYSKEDESFDEAYDISKFYVDYELTDEEIDFFEAFLNNADRNCPMSLDYYLSILMQIRH